MKNSTKNSHGSLSTCIVDELSKDIAEGIIEPGDKLSEVALSKRFGTSRGPIREGLRRLEERGLVIFAPNVGARVASYSLGDFIKLFQTREALEGMAARLAAESMPPDNKADLRKIIEEHEKIFLNEPEKPYYQSSGDWDFHYLIARSCGNPILSNLLCNELYQRLRLCRRQHRYIKGRGRRAFVEHRRILEAIEDADGEMAEFMMRRHVAAARSVLESFLSAGMT